LNLVLNEVLCLSLTCSEPTKRTNALPFTHEQRSSCNAHPPAVDHHRRDGRDRRADDERGRGGASVATNAVETNVVEPTTVHEWLTTPGVTTPTDTQLPLNATVPNTPVAVHVDPNVRYQTVSGFGAAITDSAAHVL